MRVRGGAWKIRPIGAIKAPCPCMRPLICANCFLSIERVQQKIPTQNCEQGTGFGASSGSEAKKVICTRKAILEKLVPNFHKPFGGF